MLVTMINIGIVFCVAYTAIRATIDLIEHAHRFAAKRAELRSETESHPWMAFLYARSRVIDWLYSGEGDEQCKGSDANIAALLRLEPENVRSIRTRDRSQ